MQAAIVERLSPGRFATMQSAIVRHLPLLSALVAVGMMAFGGAMVINSRADAWLQATQAADNLSIAMEREIRRTIATYDLSITGAVNVLQLPGLAAASPAIRRAALFDRAITAQYLGSMVVTNVAGDIIFDSAADPPHKLNLADREHFIVLRDRASVGLYISRPLLNRMANNDPVIVFSRRVNDAEGRFAGTVTGGLRLAYFQDLFASLDVGASGSVTLVRTDGRIIARYPLHPGDIDHDLTQSPAFRASLSDAFGQFVETSRVTGKPRLYTYRHIGDLPLILTISVAEDGIYADWWRKASVIGAVLTTLGGATIGLGQLCGREMRRRKVVETHLLETAEELSTLAATDGLTGLDNRRTFDSKLDREWRRAERTADALSVLMIDVDGFKAYNDTYGHPAGDAVLRAIAGCLQRNIRVTADSAARYGGEEFVVILPETDGGGAEIVAARITGALAALDLAHVGSPSGRVTVSMGLATARPQRGGSAEALVKCADEALFEAKHRGRDRLCVAANVAARIAA